MADSQVSVGGSIAFACSLWLSRWRNLWGAMALTSLAATVSLAGAYGQHWDLQVLGGVMQVLATPVLYGAVLRLALRNPAAPTPGWTVGHAGLQWQAMEWRLLAADLLRQLFIAIVIMVAAVFVGAVTVGILINKGVKSPEQLFAPPKGGVAAADTVAEATRQMDALATALTPSGQMAVLGCAAIAAAIVVYLSVRLYFALPATADNQKIQVLRTFRLTKGHFWRIFFTAFVLSMPLTFAQFLVASTVQADRLGLAPVVMSPAAAMVSALVCGIVYGAVVSPLTAAAIAYYYRNLKGPDVERA